MSNFTYLLVAPCGGEDRLVKITDEAAATLEANGIVVVPLGVKALEALAA